MILIVTDSVPVRRTMTPRRGVRLSEHAPGFTLDPLNDDTLRRFRVLFNRFRRDLDSALERATKEYSQHMPSKGDVCEAAIVKYLSETLGSRYAIASNGHVFDRTGAQSKELDIIIYDDYWSVRLVPRDSGEPPILPVESVYAAMQIKKKLTAAELRSAISNIQSFKALKRERIGTDYITPNKRLSFGGPPDPPGRVPYMHNPYFAAIFAFDAGRSMNTVLKQLKGEVTGIPSSLWPDVVVVHNEGIILPFCSECNSSGTYISKIELDGHTPGYLLDKYDGAYSLLGFHLLLMQHLHFSILGPLDFHSMYAKLAYVARLTTFLKESGTSL
jgi:hypothetical protein